MSPTWTDIVTAVAALAAVVFAATAWMAALSSLRTSYRPVVRVAPAFSGDRMDRGSVILKNIGFGPALSVMLFEARDLTGPPLAQTEVIEVLGDDMNGAPRRGRVVVPVPNQLQHMRDYLLIYQDIAGGWHETLFTARERDFVVRLLGPLRWWHSLTNRTRLIPRDVQDRGNVVRSSEAL